MRTPLALLAAVAAVLPTAPATASITPVVAVSGEPAVAADPGPRSTVTLVTGDQVVTTGRGAALRVAGVRPGPGRERIGQLTATRDGRVFVYPGDAVELVRSGRLDERLFDVTGLVAMGYDDAHRSDLPLIVRRSGGAPAGARVTRALPELGMTAVRRPSADAATFWRSVTSGTTRVWLDGRARVTVDQSVPRVGAPAAWRRGHTGKGARVGVLDTGYDRDHPDLAGKVVAEKDFTGSPAGTADGNGHGTHVASIVAGSGAAAGGRYRGVAPDADLVVGKVCADEGWCADSAILDGMAWAVEQRVSVVNLSLGAGPSDGTDPLSTAVNELTARSGVLFVVSAGNFGADSTVAAPAVADAALAVASMSKQDTLSEFSSRGPRTGEFAVKPDIAAPGGDIVAARAAGTLPDVSVSEHYARLSGTSMAAPHVTGAAALLAASHPDWPAQRLKAVLMGTAKPLGDVYATGAGRLDVDAADRATVVADRGSVGFTAPGRQTITYRNDGDRPVTLTPAVTLTDRAGDPAPAGLVTVEPRTFTVPAGGSAPVTVTVYGKVAEPGLFGGRLTVAGAVTALGVSIAAEPGTLTITATAAGAGQLGAFAIAEHLRTGEQHLIWTEDDRPTPVPLPAGRYRLTGQVNGGVPIAGTDEYLITTSTLFAEEVDVAATGTSLVLDGRTAGPVDRDLDDPEARHQEGMTAIDLPSPPTGDGHPRGIGVSTFNLHDVFLLPSEKIDGLRLYDVASWQDPVLSTTVVGTGREVLLRDPDPVDFTGDVTAPLVDVGAADDLAGTPPAGAIALFTPPADLPQEVAEARVAALRAAGAVLVIVGEADFWGSAPRVPGTLTAFYIETTELRELVAAGPVSLRVRGTMNSERGYLTHHQVDDALPDGVTWSDRRDRMAAVTANLHTSRAPGSSVPLWASFLSGRGYLEAVAMELRPPARSTLYVSPGVPVGFDTVAAWDYPPTGWQSADPRAFGQGERATMNWLKAPYGPAMTTATPRAVRFGDKLTVDLPMFTNSGGPGRYGRYDPTTESGTTTLTRDGRRIGHNDVPGLATFDLPPGRGRYELTVDAGHRLPYWPLATRITDRWTFTSATTSSSSPLPLLDVEYDLPLDLTNSAPAAKALTGSLWIGHRDGGSPVTTVTVEVSHDDGATWRRAGVTPAGAGWTVRIPAGAPTARFVSLRTTATDTAGNSLTETLVRAYGLTPEVSAVYGKPRTG